MKNPVFENPPGFVIINGNSSGTLTGDSAHPEPVEGLSGVENWSMVRQAHHERTENIDL